jgi:hypothetical protein
MDGHAGRTRAEPGAVILLEPRNEKEHRLLPVEKNIAVERLVRESVRAPDQASHPVAADAFGAVADLVRRSRTYSLSPSPHLESLHELVRPILEREP